MSGLAFDAMRTTPPPPLYCDTVGINPFDYISVQSRDGQTFVVHRACLCVSPLIRRAFARRKSVQLTDIVISFDNQWQDESYGSSSANHINTYYSKNKKSLDVNNYSRKDDMMKNVINSFTQSNLTRDNMARKYSAKTPSRLANSANSNESFNRTASPQSNTRPNSNTVIIMKPGQTSDMRQQSHSQQGQESNNWNTNEADQISNNADTSRVNVLSANSAARYSVGWSTTARSSVSGETEPHRDSEVKFGNDDDDDDNDDKLNNDAEHIVHNTHKHTFPVTLTDTPLHDCTVQIYFPTTSGATLETVISYMYYKLRYDGHLELQRPQLQIPMASAIEIMKLAHTL